jgi:hypothetical protein
MSHDQLVIIAIAAGCAGFVGVVGLATAWALRGASLRWMPAGVAIVVVALVVSASGLVAPVALSNVIHDARYVTGPDATPPDTAALSKLSPFASSRGLTIGLTTVR